MRRLRTTSERGSFLAALSVGEKLNVICTSQGSISYDPALESEMYVAEVVEKVPGSSPDNDRTLVQVDFPGVIGGFMVELWHGDGESMKQSPDPRPTDGYANGCWINVAEEQDDEEVLHEATMEDAPAPKALPPSTGLAVNLPRGASWLLEMAKILDSEAERYNLYSPPQSSLSTAAGCLRSAVGHVLSGNYEKK